MTKEPKFHGVVRAKVYEQVAAQIRDAILQGALVSGQGLPAERALSEQFGVSRATIREALRHLQAQGLLAPRGRTSSLQAAGPDAAAARFRESLVHVVQRKDIPLTDLVELRVALECTAFTRSAATPVAAHLDEARAALLRMAEARVTASEFHEADVAFHVALVAASGNQALHLAMLAVKDSIQLYLAQTLQARSFKTLRPRIVEEHGAILHAIEQGNAKSATALLRAHLSEFYFT
jgi:DNA-binding FadR family transcriptional regulator